MQGVLPAIYQCIKYIFCVVPLVIVITAEAWYVPDTDSQETITLNYPPDKTVMEFDLLSISLRVPPGSADVIKVDVNAEEKKTIIPDSEFECFSVRLEVGINRISLTAIKKDKQVEKFILSVFHRSELESKFGEPPAGFKKDYFHAKEHMLCSRCHVLEPGKSDRKAVDIASFPAETLSASKETIAATSTCYSCHKSIASYPFVHGPVYVWSCLSCHDPGSEPRYSVKKPDTKICFSCHIKQKDDWYAKKYFHGPFTAGKCAICHSPHAAEYPFNLIKSTWELCTSCHPDKGNGEHIVSGFLNIPSHPTRGRQDPLRKGKELTCASCHDPHASDSPKLWRLKVETGIALCKECHIPK